VSARPTRLVLVRHGQAVCNVAGVVGGPKGCRGLSATGRAQVRRLAAWLAASGELRAASALYSSPLPRARETAELLRPAVGGGGLVVQVEEDLAELRPGLLDGRLWAEVAASEALPDWDLAPDEPLGPEAESWTGFVARAHAALQALADRHRGQDLVVVCHAGVIEAAVLGWLGSRRPRLGLPIAHGSLTWFERRGSTWVLLRGNDQRGVRSSPDTTPGGEPAACRQQP
jgi:probable phosphoglycerate mutase